MIHFLQRYKLSAVINKLVAGVASKTVAALSNITYDTQFISQA